MVWWQQPRPQGLCSENGQVLGCCGYARGTLLRWPPGSLPSPTSLAAPSPDPPPVQISAWVTRW